MEIKPIIKEDFLVLDEDASISELIAQMRNEEKRTALVFRKNKFLGIVEKKKLIKSRIDAGEAKVKNFLQRAPLLKENEEIVEAANLMFQSDLEFLPVEKDKRIVGVVSALDLIKLAQEMPETKIAKIRDIKLVKPTKVDKEDQIAKVIYIMHTEGVDHVPVFEEGKLYGIVTLKDLLRKYLSWTPQRDCSARFNQEVRSKAARVDFTPMVSLPISAISTSFNLFTINKDAPLSAAIVQLVEKGVSDLLVMDKEELQGVLTLRNILAKIGTAKAVPKYKIEYIGLKELAPEHQAEVMSIVENEAVKLQRKVQDELKLIVHLKEYEKGKKKEKREKFSVSLRVEYPGQTLATSEFDWDLVRAVHKTLENAYNALKTKTRSDDTQRKRK